jgi:hypothetical protein
LKDDKAVVGRRTLSQRSGLQFLNEHSALDGRFYGLDEKHLPSNPINSSLKPRPFTCSRQSVGTLVNSRLPVTRRAILRLPSRRLSTFAGWRSW